MSRRICPYCGQPVPAPAMTCPHCGRKIGLPVVVFLAALAFTVAVILYVTWSMRP